MAAPRRTTFTVHSPTGPIRDEDMAPKLRAFRTWAGKSSVSGVMTNVSDDAIESADWDVSVHRNLTGAEIEDFIKVIRRVGLVYIGVR